jgi:hypothetical protein
MINIPLVIVSGIICLTCIGCIIQHEVRRVKAQKKMEKAVARMEPQRYQARLRERQALRLERNSRAIELESYGPIQNPGHCVVRRTIPA